MLLNYLEEHKPIIATIVRLWFEKDTKKMSVIKSTIWRNAQNIKGISLHMCTVWLQFLPMDKVRNCTYLA